MSAPRNPWVIAALLSCLLGGCAADPLIAPPTKPGVVIWRMVPQEDVAKECGYAGEGRIGGCELEGGIIITRPPQAGDYSLIDTLAHEVAHAQGFTHPSWIE
jgi:hypothetical protein